MCIVLRIVSFLLLIHLPQHHSIPAETESLDSVTLLPRTKRYRIKSGSSISLSCNKAKSDVTWQFKSCGMNYKGMNCETAGEGDLNTNQGIPWKLLHHYNGNRMLKIENTSLDDVGIYRCISGNIIRKIFILEIDAVTFEWPPPRVMSVIPNQKVVRLNGHLTINCSVSSRTPPKILWFKVCWTNLCELDFAAYEIEIEGNFNCLCLINNTSDSTYNWENLYVSKLHIFNTHVWDGGTYVCSALSSDGKDHKNVTIIVDFQRQHSYNFESYTCLLLIPLIFILLYIVSYVFCVSKRRKRDSPEQLQYLKCTSM
ncbi:uncharacterized protein LOC123313183 [Coccinella septempunctata]|uniref:uncharacterized protein LOC123313183 n=1 Tax=Coccinella septempunctata TaxID=41139 RepID=UPI001D097361|nr:uncharacterized protein LOC123313183 [Coccinella septempunctata]